jgi:hypothetical protein
MTIDGKLNVNNNRQPQINHELTKENKQHSQSNTAEIT